MKNLYFNLKEEKSEKKNIQVLTVSEMRMIRGGGGGDIIDPVKKI